MIIKQTYALFILSLFMILTTSCNKQEACLKGVCIDDEWVWVESYGSIAGLTITPITEMEERKLIIDEDSYREFVNDSLVLETTYEYVISNELEGFSRDSLVLKLGTGNWYDITEDNDELVIFEPCFDCWEHRYVRK